MEFNVRDWVYIDDVCYYGQIVEIKGNIAYVEYNTGTGGVCMPFKLSELKLSEPFNKVEIEVIKDKYSFKYVTCPHCKSELRVKKESLTYTHNKGYNIAIIACPCCNRNLVLKEEG